MGAKESKSKVDHHGDQQIRIINTQQEHSVVLKDHEFVLYLILIIVIVQLAIQVIVLMKNYFDKKALRKARSIIALSDVAVSK